MTQSTLARSGAVDQVLNNQSRCLLNPQLRQWHYGSEQLPYVAHRQPWQHIHLELPQKLWRTGVFLCPLVLGLAYEPCGKYRHRQMMLPRHKFLSPQFIPSSFALCILVRTLCKVPLALHPCQSLYRCIQRRIAKGKVTLALCITAHYQVLLYRLPSITCRPHTCDTKLIAQFPPLRISDPYTSPPGISPLSNCAHLLWFVIAEHLSLLFDRTSLTRLGLWHSNNRSVLINKRIYWNISHIYQSRPAYLSPKPHTSPIERITAHCLKCKSLFGHSLYHLPSQFYLCLKLSVLRNTQTLTLRRHRGVKPVLRQKQLPIHPRPYSIINIGQKRAYLTHLDLAKPTIVLTSRSCALRRGLLISALVQKKHPTCGKFRHLCDFLSYFDKNRLRRPRGVSHKVLNILTRVPCGASDGCEITFSGHSEQPLEVVKSIVVRIPSSGLETLSIVLPELVQRFAKSLDGFLGQAPGLWIKDNILMGFRISILFCFTITYSTINWATTLSRPNVTLSRYLLSKLRCGMNVALSTSPQLGL